MGRTIPMPPRPASAAAHADLPVGPPVGRRHTQLSPRVHDLPLRPGGPPRVRRNVLFFAPMRTSTQFVCSAEMLGVLLRIRVGIILTSMQLAFYFETLNPHS